MDEKIKRIYCSICNNRTDKNPCLYCASTSRDRSQICVVESDSGIYVVEKTQNYDGLYHVLHGSLAPARDIGPDRLMLANLMPRLMPENNGGVAVKEIIVAVNPTTESEATANYLARLLKPLGIKIEKIEIETGSESQPETIH